MRYGNTPKIELSQGMRLLWNMATIIAQETGWEFINEDHFVLALLRIITFPVGSMRDDGSEKLSLSEVNALEHERREVEAAFQRSGVDTEKFHDRLLEAVTRPDPVLPLDRIWHRDDNTRSKTDEAIRVAVRKAISNDTSDVIYVQMPDFLQVIASSPTGIWKEIFWDLDGNLGRLK
jgi:hypothetical protein